MNLIDRFWKWHLTRKQKEQQKAKKVVDDKKLEEIYHNLKSLYDFVRFLNKNFTNRRERKDFWRKVSEGEEPLIATLDNLLKRYGVKTETLKKIEEERMKRYETKVETSK